MKGKKGKKGKGEVFSKGVKMTKMLYLSIGRRFSDYIHSSVSLQPILPIVFIVAIVFRK